MQSQKFEMPQYGFDYINAILGRCENLIIQGIWNGLHIGTFRKWLSNFKTQEEKYFAACVLDSLIYRCEDQTIAMMKQLLQRILPDLHKLSPMPLKILFNFEQAFAKAGVDPKIRLVTVLRSNDAHSKSAPAIARLFKRHLKINESWISKSTDIKILLQQNIKTFIFIDDFLGTGHQFEEFMKAENIISLLNSAYFAYVPLVAYIDGIEYLQKRYPNLKISAVEVLDKTYNLFDVQCDCFQDGTNKIDAVKHFYYTLIKKHSIPFKGSDRRGYGKCGLAYAFSHSVPDNCLPILWYQGDNWHPLFNR